MNLSGVYISILIGKTVPKPIDMDLSFLLKDLEVISSDDAPTGLQMTFDSSLSDDPKSAAKLLSGKDLQPFNRIVVSSVFQAKPVPIFDGFITRQHVNAGNEIVPTEVSVTAEDASVMMDLKQVIAEHPAQDEPTIVTKLLGKYAKYGLIPKVKRPGSASAPLPKDRVPVQVGTDFQYINRLANKFGYVFYIDPGPLPMQAMAIWGPPDLKGKPQKAITINMGSFDNASDVAFSYDALRATEVLGHIQDTKSNKIQKVSVRKPDATSLAKKSVASLQKTNIRQTLFPATGSHTFAQAKARAQGMVNQAALDVVTAKGTLNSLEYSGVLKARQLVAMRGAGTAYDGVYYVRKVSHNITEGEYVQTFELVRDGLESKQMVVPV